MVNAHVTREIVEKVAIGLQELRERVVFVGGAVIGLYADDPGAEEVRPTFDVDLSLQLASYGEWVQFQERLAALGFVARPDAEVICRFGFQGLTVDVMPDSEAILGFTNPWYRPGLERSWRFEIAPALTIRLLPFPYMLATKFAAWRSRGGSDPRLSHDFEDLIYLTNNRLRLVEEVMTADEPIRRYLQQGYRSIWEHGNREEIVSCHLAEADRLPLVLDCIRAIAE